MSRIIIIGAGLSGLTAAHELSKNCNNKITILEELNEIGGRTKSVKVNDIDVNIGGFIIFPY